MSTSSSDREPAASHLAPTRELFAPAAEIPALKGEALEGFLNQADYDRVVDEMRLASGAVWPIPVTLDVNADFAAKLSNGQRIALKDQENVVLAILEVQSVYQPDKAREARQGRQPLCRRPPDRPAGADPLRL
jgi:hypothetical protein